MNVSEREKTILRESLRRFQMRNDDMARRFYANLFDIAPETRPMFGRDIIGQTQMTMLSLSAIIGLLDHQDECREMIEGLARRHVGYGVRAGHYPLVGEALMRTIRQIFADGFDAEYYAAWETAFAEMSRIMIAAAQGQNHPPS